MRHCVLSYKRECEEGYCSIWSMTRRENSVVKRALTIQVNDGQGRFSRENRYYIAQSSGLANRLPRSNERAVLNEFSAYIKRFIPKPREKRSNGW